MALVETVAARAEKSRRGGFPAGFVAVVAVDFLVDGFPLGALAGALQGGVVTGGWYVAVLAFAAVALLFLALEELLGEAHEVAETPWVMSTLFVGMLAFLLLEMAVSR